MRDPLYGDEAPEVWVRCILCGETMDKDWFDTHDCDILPYEEVDTGTYL